MSNTVTNEIKKDALTAEGVLVWATNIGLAVAAAVPNGLNWTHAGAYIAFVTGLHTVARTLGRAQVAAKAVGLPPATPFDPISPDVVGQAVSDLFKNAGVQPDAEPGVAAGGSDAVSDSDTTGEPAAPFDQEAKPDPVVLPPAPAAEAAPAATTAGASPAYAA